MDEVWVNILATLATLAVTTVAAFAQHLLRYLIAKFKLEDVEREAVQCLMDGMSEIEDKMIRGIKAAAADGKLTADEIGEAKDAALKIALNASKGKARDYLMKISDARINAIIKELLPTVRGE